jgi:hypothetical protein
VGCGGRGQHQAQVVALHTNDANADDEIVWS